MADNPQPVSISGDIRGARAIPYLIDPKKHPADETPGELLFIADKVTAVDANSGAVLRASIEEHLSRRREATACVWKPQEDTAWETLHDLLRPLPERCAFPDDTQNPVRDPDVFLPAHRVVDMAAAELLSRYVRVAGASAGLSGTESGYLATALPALVDNGLRHAPASPCGVVVCGAVERESRDAQLVAVDLGDSLSGAEDPVAALRECLDRSRDEFGGLSNLTKLATRRDLDISLLISSGTGRSRWRDRWRHDEAGFAPGWCARISVHGRRRRSQRRRPAPKPT